MDWITAFSQTVFIALFFVTLFGQWEIHPCLMVFPVCWCGATPASPVWWRTQGRRRSGAVCPCCVWKVCWGSSQPASSATQTRWPSSSLPWVRHAQFSNYKNSELKVVQELRWHFVFFFQTSLRTMLSKTMATPQRSTSFTSDSFRCMCTRL